MKNEYVKPEMNFEEFSSNSYVAACGDTNKEFNFTCNATIKGNHWSWGEKYDNVYYWPSSQFNPATSEPNISSYSSAKATYLSLYHPCGSTHKASASTNFYLGFVDKDDDGKYDNGEGVIIWRGPKNDNTHCTSNLNVKTWETAKS